MLQVTVGDSLLCAHELEAPAGILPCLEHPQPRVSCCPLGRRQPGLPGWQVLRYAEAQGHNLEGLWTQGLGRETGRGGAEDEMGSGGVGKLKAADRACARGYACITLQETCRDSQHLS